MSTPEIMPNLQLVPMENIRFHERPEQNRTGRLVDRIKVDAVLRNPPIVADMEDGNYLLLDGANRVSVFRTLEFSHMPVQVVDYGDQRIQLKGWHHLLVDGRDLDLKSTYGTLPGVRLEPVEHDRLSHLLELRMVYAILVDETTACWGLFPDGENDPQDVHNRIATLDKIVAGYEGQRKLERIKLADFSQLPDVMGTVKHQLCLFPVITKNELLQLAAENRLIPTGLSRHLIPGRALGLNIGLQFLQELKTDEEKQQHFDDHLSNIAIHGRVRFYEESVFVMNE